MKFIYNIFIPIVVITLPLTSIAETVFKSVDKSGTAVFSDEKTPDAEKIIVQPNVIDVDVPDMPTPAHKSTPKQRIMQTTHDSQGHSQATEIGSGTATAGNLKRKIRNVTNGESINRPAARAGGHR